MAKEIEELKIKMEAQSKDNSNELSAVNKGKDFGIASVAVFLWYCSFSR